jgi:hypothetical protein
MLTGDGDGQRPRFFIGGKAHDVQAERNHSIDAQGEKLLVVHMRSPESAHSVQLSTRPAIYDTLDECQGTHSSE